MICFKLLMMVLKIAFMNIEILVVPPYGKVTGQPVFVYGKISLPDELIWFSFPVKPRVGPGNLYR